MARLILILFAMLLLAMPVSAQQLPANNYAMWLQQLQLDAVNNGITSETVHTALDDVQLDDRVIELDQKQPEGTVTFEHYLHNTVSTERVEEGRSLLERHEKELDEIAEHYGVQPQVIVALWGVESSFGQDSGHFDVVDSLVTLAYQGRRADFFRKELFEALRIVDQEHIAPSSLHGSWAGAMGQCQFMPSTYLRYAVDYSGDGKRDIWESKRDVWASIANYIAAEGWNDEHTWGRQVELEKDIPASEIGLDHQRMLSEWEAMGVRSADGSKLPDKALSASLIQPDGADGRSFLVYDNFRALMRWNHSTYFATAVGIFADRIK